MPPFIHYSLIMLCKGDKNTAILRHTYREKYHKDTTAPNKAISLAAIEKMTRRLTRLIDACSIIWSRFSQSLQVELWARRTSLTVFNAMPFLLWFVMIKENVVQTVDMNGLLHLATLLLPNIEL